MTFRESLPGWYPTDDGGTRLVRKGLGDVYLRADFFMGHTSWNITCDGIIEGSKKTLSEAMDFAEKLGGKEASSIARALVKIVENRNLYGGRKKK